MGANETDTGQAAAEFVCISCGKDLGPGQAVIYRGKPCPNCGQRWEGTAKAPIAGGDEQPGGAGRLPHSPQRMAATVLFAFAAGVIAVPLGLAISGSQGLSSPGNIAEAFGILMGSFTIAGLAGGLAAGLIASGTPGCLAVFGGCLVAVVGAGWANAALLVPFLLTGIGAGFGAGVVVRRLRERRRVG